MIQLEFKKISILSHRGLDPEKKGYFAESTREAFTDQVARGFGLEFDLQLTRDGQFVILHDSSLARPTKGADTRKISEIESAELLEMNMEGCHIASFPELLALIAKHPDNPSINAIHIKAGMQKPEALTQILEELEHVDTERFILFDVSIETARFLKAKNSRLHLAPSLAHPYDIERYNSAVGGTLLPLERVIEDRGPFDWVWLDEWDRTDRNGGTKSLYSKETFDRLRKAGFKIALVTPELHKTSPGLLGGEAHQDATNNKTLRTRFKEIASLRPDAICTDYPDTVRKFFFSIKIK